MLRPQHAWSRALAMVPIVVGLTVLAGWALHVEALKTVYPGWVTLKANTALAFLLGGVGLLGRSVGSRSPRAELLATVCGVTVALIGALTLAQYLTGANLHVDELLFREPNVGSGTSHPGRMAPNSALNFVLLGPALVLTRSRARRARSMAQTCALVAVFIALLALVGYLFAAHLLVTVASRTRMAPLTIASFLSLGGGIVMVTRDAGAAASFVGTTLGGTFGRPLLLASTMAPIGIGGLVLLGQRLGLWDAAFQGAVVAVLSILVLDLVIWRSARSLDRIDAERASTLAELRRLVKNQDDFLSVASHEMKTPLTVLNLKIQWLLRKRESVTSEKVIEQLSDARRQIARLVFLMEMMLDAKRVEAGSLQLETEQLDLAALVRTVVERHGDDAARAKTTIEVHAPEPLFGTWDRARLEQVVSHLLRNAVTYCDETKVTVEVDGANGTAILRVRDHGGGIDPADHDRIFGRFERAASARHFGGLGLGLWLCQAIVRAHGGAISVESAIGAGTTLEVRLPIARPSLA
ncbi:MAG: HAMP domain-containing sensor histidine kinase [Polyangiales bacterium]